MSKAKTTPRTTTVSSPTRNGSSRRTRTRNPSTTDTKLMRRARRCIEKGRQRRTARLQEKRHLYKSQSIGTKWEGRNEVKSSANISWGRMAPSHLTTPGGKWSDANSSPHGTRTTRRTQFRISAIGNKRSLEDCCPYHASQQARRVQRQTETLDETIRTIQIVEEKELELSRHVANLKAETQPDPTPTKSSYPGR